MFKRKKSVYIIHSLGQTNLGNHYRRWRNQTSVVKRKQAAVWHVCSLVLFRCLAYSDPLQTLGLCCSLSPAQTRSLISIFLCLSWAASTDTLFSLTSSFLSGVCLSCFLSLTPLSALSALSPYPLSFPSLSQSLSLPSLAILPLCISIFELACLVMMRFDPPCWMILTWYPTSGWFLSRLTSKS